MPNNPRPLSQGPGTGTYDSPPASSGPSSPYPDRHSRLRRALRNTSELAQEIEADIPVAPTISLRSTINPRQAAAALSRMESERRELGSYSEGTGLERGAGDRGYVDRDGYGRQGGEGLGMTRPGREAEQGYMSRRRRRNSGDQDGGEGGEDCGVFTGDYRRKRRKLDVEAPARGSTAIRYGHYGQVEAGKLRMMVISNDGGEHIDPRHPEIYLGAKNMLRLDKSVFCSVRSSAGVMLQHADGTPFCLEKLHIVGPEHGFTAPVREGLVYVAMDLKSLQPYLDPPYHARRSGVHEPPYRPRAFRASPERLSLSDALRDPEISAASRTEPTTHQTFDPAIHTDPWPENGMYAYRSDPDFQCEHEATDYPLSSSDDQSLPVTLLSDEEPGPEDSSTQEVIDYRLRRMRLMQRRRDMENFDRAERWGGISNALSETERERYRERDYERERAENPWAVNRLEHLRSRSRPGLSPQPEEARASYSLEDGSDDPGVTMARFLIKRGKHKVAIKFDPPISGRYVLLKMWSGRSNVDVQSVVVKGYGGPRFFPAVQAM